MQEGPVHHGHDRCDVAAAAVDLVELSVGLVGLFTRQAELVRQSVARRLNRREYLNTIGDLLGLNMTMFDPTSSTSSSGMALCSLKKSVRVCLRGIALR